MTIVGLTMHDLVGWPDNKNNEPAERVEPTLPAGYRAWATEQEPDMVNSPPHYTQGGIETIDYMQAKATPEEFRGYLRLNCIKYLSRASLKNGVEDYKKAQWYLDKLIETYNQ